MAQQQEKVALKSDAEDGQPDILDEVAKKQMDRLHFLDAMDEIVIQQPFRGKEWWLQNCLCWEVKNVYTAFSVDKESKDTTPIFKLTEESDTCMRVCCPATVQGFNLIAELPDGHQDAGTTLFRLERPYRCGCFCCSPAMCMGRSLMAVYIGDRCIGTVEEDCICCNFEVNWSVYDAENRKLCDLKRFFCVFDCCKTSFEILIDGEETGKQITKQYVGLVKELFTKNDNFLVQFPEQFKTRESKVLLIAACMMFEYRYFENDG